MTATYRGNSGIPLTASGGSSLVTNAMTVSSIWVPQVSGLVAGDTMIMFLASMISGWTWTQPAGWTSMAHTLVAGAQDAVPVDACWKTATSTDVSATGYTVAITSHAVGQTALGSIVAYSNTAGIRSGSGTNLDFASNVNAGSPSTAVAANVASQATPTVPGGAIGATDLEVIAFVFAGDSTGTYTLSDTASGNGWTNRHTLTCAISGSFNTSIVVYEKAGASDHPTETSTRAGGHANIALALAPAAAATLPAPSLFVPPAQAVARSYFW